MDTTLLPAAPGTYRLWIVVQRDGEGALHAATVRRPVVGWERHAEVVTPLVYPDQEVTGYRVCAVTVMPDSNVCDESGDVIANHPAVFCRLYGLDWNSLEPRRLDAIGAQDSDEIVRRWAPIGKLAAKWWDKRVSATDDSAPEPGPTLAESEAVVIAHAKEQGIL